MKQIDKTLHFIERNYHLFLIIVFLILIFNLFYKLDKEPIHDWDEARHGVNAYEMMKKGDLIVNTYQQKIDYWNLKPPMSFWAIILGYKIFGPCPLALRFYSVIAALLTSVLVAVFTKKNHGRLASLVSTGTLVTTYPFIMLHCARTGDADSLFVLYSTFSIMALILMEKNIKWFYVSGISFSFAFLDKSWHALAILGIGFTFLNATGRLFRLKAREWILFLTASLAPILIWVCLRYLRDGFAFLKSMFIYDLFKRTTNTLEGHYGGIDYYINFMLKVNPVWLGLLILGFIIYLILYKRKSEILKRDYVLAIILWATVPFILYSLAKTKLSWYIYLIFPALSICLGALISKPILDSERSQGIRLVLIILFVIGLVVNEYMIVSKLTNIDSDGFQTAIHQVGHRKIYYGNRIYTLGKSWAQSLLLTTELNGLFPTNGGFKGFMNNNNKSLLIFPRNNFISQVMNKEKLKVVIKTGNVLVLKKSLK